MTKITSEFEKSPPPAASTPMERTNSPFAASHDLRAESEVDNAKTELPQGERELLNELTEAIRTITYGSIVLTIHEGRLVEFSKTIRVRSHRSRKD